MITCNALDGNEHLAVTHVEVRGAHVFRQPAVLLYPKGLPLVFIEMKNLNVKLKNTFGAMCTEKMQGSLRTLLNYARVGEQWAT